MRRCGARDEKAREPTEEKVRGRTGEGKGGKGGEGTGGAAQRQSEGKSSAPSFAYLAWTKALIGGDNMNNAPTSVVNTNCACRYNYTLDSWTVGQLETYQHMRFDCLSIRNAFKIEEKKRWKKTVLVNTRDGKAARREWHHQKGGHEGRGGNG